MTGAPSAVGNDWPNASSARRHRRSSRAGSRGLEVMRSTRACTPSCTIDDAIMAGVNSASRARKLSSVSTMRSPGKYAPRQGNAAIWRYAISRRRWDKRHGWYCSMSASAASRRSSTKAVAISGRVFSTRTRIPRIRMLRRAGEPIERRALLGCEAAGAILLRFLEEPYDFVAIDRVEVVETDVTPALEWVAVPDAADDRRSLRHHFLLPGARGR